MEIDNGLTTKPIPGLIAQLAIPASIGMFFNTMFNVVDTYFSGLISTEAIAALSLSFPVFFVILAVGFGISTGTTALIANALGARDESKAQLYAIQSVSFTILLSMMLSLLGLYSAPYLFGFLGAKGSYLAIAVSYINIIFYGLASLLGMGLTGIWWGIFLVTWSATIFTMLYVRSAMNTMFVKA